MRVPAPILATIAATAVLVAGCTHEVGGTPVAGPSHVIEPISGGELDMVLLTPRQLSDILGADVRPRVDVNEPVGGAAAGPCGPLDNAGMRSFLGDGLMGFHLLLLSDGTEFDRRHVVAEAAGIYPDSGSATTAFTKATSGLAACDGAEIHHEAAWRFAVNDITADTVRWNKEQTDLPFLWVCYGQARVRNNVILQAMVCRGDDDGQANAETVLNRMSATVWELAGH